MGRMRANNVFSGNCTRSCLTNCIVVETNKSLKDDLNWILTALTIPDDGKASVSQFYTTKIVLMYNIFSNSCIIAIDLDRDAYEIELPIIKRPNIEHKINFIQPSAYQPMMNS
uniref:caffeoyl-CoA O-methyltransferase n=1 Tax=Solanum lycopersicum TaxID=4081 RepID=A0A3Q7HCY6_SOLLC